MNVAIRADASASIGGGHLMRCLTLANALAATGARVCFLTRADPICWEDKLRAAGHVVEFLGTPDTRPTHAGPLHPDQDSAQCARILREGVDLLVVDHYQLDAHWERAMRPHTKRLLVIDDLANRPHDADWLLDQNLLPKMETRYQTLVPPHCRLLLGPTYALLRPEFMALRSAASTRDGSIRRLLLFFGCGDLANMTQRALDEIQDLNLPVDVVIGHDYAHKNELANRCAQSDDRWRLHIQTDRMAELMMAADLALGAGGTQHWERCALGLPALVVTVATNQIDTTRLLQEKNACYWLGHADQWAPGTLRATLDSLLNKQQTVKEMSMAARQIIPQHGGTDAVVAHLKEGDER